MSYPGAADHPDPLRVAIVGSGPAGFYVAQRLLARKDVRIAVDMYDRLPTPFGLVRFGVAPDHQEIKAVTRVFDKVAAHPGFRFYGNVEVGGPVTLEQLTQFYHQICYTTGAQTDRRMGIPGEDLVGSHAATEFVAWYNGHPDYRDCRFDLTAERVAVVGVGNVAVDVARILCRTTEELATTDITDYALDALRHSRVKQVYMLGRRGPAQAAFTNPEVRELGELPGTDIIASPQEIALDPLSQADLERSEDGTLRKRLEILKEFAARPPAGRARQLILRFLVSPVEIKGDSAGNVSSMKLVRNKLVAGSDGDLRPRATDEFEELPVGLVFRSVGYRGIALPGLPFDDKSAVVPNEKGRVVDAGGCALTGLYVAGWIKRGPTGVIGTNKPDAFETVDRMLEDAAAGTTLRPSAPDPAALDTFLRQRQPAVVSYADWQKVNGLEVGKGEPLGRPRVKYTSTKEMLAALGR